MPQADTACGGFFNATADSFVRESEPENNYGDQALLVSQSSRTGMNERILLQFDPAGSVPEGATIQKAELELTLYQDPEPLTITLQAVQPGRRLG